MSIKFVYTIITGAIVSASKHLSNISCLANTILGHGRKEESAKTLCITFECTVVVP
jgi:hypothetical protein